MLERGVTALRARPAVVASFFVFVVTIALFWPASLMESTPVSAFGDSHVWALDHIARIMTGQAPFSPATDRAGFPTLRQAPVLGWAPALAALPLRPLLGPLGAVQLVLLLSPAAAALVGAAWLRRVTGGDPWDCAWAAAAWALGAPGLANLAAGNIDKAQVWVYPAWLLLGWVVVGRMDRRRVALALAGMGAVTLAAVFSEPYFGLFLPLVGAPLLLLAAWTRPDRRAALTRAAAALVVTGLALLPAAAWFRGATGLARMRVFSPAPPPMIGGLLFPGQAPFADPLALLWAAPDAAADPTRPVHVVYLGVPLLLGALAAVIVGVRQTWKGNDDAHPGGREPARGLAAGLLLAVVATIIALGPSLILGGKWQNLGYHPYWLPMSVLETLGYPLAKGGQYYRAAPLVTLGLATVLTAGLARTRLPAWAGPAFALVLTLDAARATGGWPRPRTPVIGRAACAAIAESPAQGAVLTLPLSGDQTDGGRKLLLAALHGRATTALPLHLPRPMLIQEAPWLATWEAAVATGAPGRPAAALRALGFAFVLHTPYGDEDVPSLAPDALERTLGAPTRTDGDVRLWAIGGP